MHVPCVLARRLFFAFAIAIAGAFTASIAAQIPTRNVNMVSGLVWPDGDPFLQRQNEPSIAASTRNPMHLLAGSNDYRSVDLPIVLSDADGEVGDAWLSLYKSTDGGERWTSTLLPGYPHDGSLEGQTSPIRGYHAAADPVVRAGSNGLLYYAGLAFDRTEPNSPPGKSAIFVARFIDNNNQEAGDPIKYINTSLVFTNPGGATNIFLDKPWMAVDIPRAGAGTCNITTNNEHGPFTQSVRAGNVYAAFTVKSVDAHGDRWDLYFSRSTNCGAQFSAPIRISRPEDRVNQGATITIAPTTGAVFIAWRRIDLAPDLEEDHAIVVARSTDFGTRWDPPGVARRFPRGKKVGLDPNHFEDKGKKKNTMVSQTTAADLLPFDQGSSASALAFRTNAYPTMTADGTGRLYLAWTERGFVADPARPDPTHGDARIVLSTSADGAAWSAPIVVADAGQLGHQIMPALSFAGGKLMVVYYDLQEDRSAVFTKNIDDATAFSRTSPDRRHTIDIRVSMANGGAAPVFEASRSVSAYMMGTRGSSGPLEQMQVNPPNLPLFRLGTTPFIGDYIDLAPSPAFVPNGTGGWIYNTASTSTPPVFHVAWTDNRDVKPPLDRNWTRYTPPHYNGLRPTHEPGEEIEVCLNGYAGTRNQNIYTARVTGGLIVGSPQNSKPLNTQFARAFVVFAKNTTTTLAPRVFRMTILNQPVNGRASFSQFPAPPFGPDAAPPLTVIDVTVPRLSSAARTVYVTSSEPRAPVNVDVSEITGVGGTEIVGGLEGTIHLNLDVSNPEVDNPEVDNPEVDNPEVDNAEVYNPEVDNPEVDNPEVDNPEVDNPEVDNPEVDNPEVDNIEIGNPEVDNPEVDNPEVDNPEVDNPEVDNPEVDNGAILEGGGVITDITWKIRNVGNTTTAYNVNLFLRRNSLPTTGTAQLLIYRIYKTPIIRQASCDVATTTQNVLHVNIPSPTLVLAGGEPSEPNDSDENHATIAVEPGGEFIVDLRVSDPDASNNVIVDGASIDPEWVPERDVFLILQPQPVDTPLIPPGSGPIEPPLVGADPWPALTVTSAADDGPGSLREAMTTANAQPGLNRINFNIGGGSSHTITPLTLLPNQTDAVIIDGSTQPGYAGTPLIEINGNGIFGSGIKLHGGNSTIRGLAINEFQDSGIAMEFSGGNGIFASYVGVALDGLSPAGNATGGITGDTDGNVIGSLAAVDRNLISGNAFWAVNLSGNSNRVEGNYIGLDRTGNARIPNTSGVLLFGGSLNVVGGNVIAGNTGDGVAVTGSSNMVEKNKIGTNAAGTAQITNLRGVSITDGINNRVVQNLISGNQNEGVLVRRSAADPTGTSITGNMIGTDAAGTAAIANRKGIVLEGVSAARIGGSAAARNVVSGNTEEGVYLGPAGGAPSTGTVVEGNLIGLNAAGSAAVPNGTSGISIVDSSANTIGGTTAGLGNTISGNTTGVVIVASDGSGAANDNIVIGNRVGTDLSGLAPIANAGFGVMVFTNPTGTATNNRIGGALAGEGNIISGNAMSGVTLQASIGSTVSGSRIEGNFIGVGADGSTDLGNGGNGVLIFSAADTVVGSAGGRNIISGNSGWGVLAPGSSNTAITGNFIGTDAAGTAALANGGGGVSVSGSLWRIGSIGAGNVISGNTGRGIFAIGANGVIRANKVGLNATGTAILANSGNGIDVDSAPSVEIASNTASGNAGTGIRVEASNNATIKSNIVGLLADGVGPAGNGGDGIRAIAQSGTLIGGAGQGNVVGHNASIGVQLHNATLTRVYGNKIGTDITGMLARPNGMGLQSTGGTTGSIGGGSEETRNLISGNSPNPGTVVIDAAGLFIEGNYIGVSANGTAALANSIGVHIAGGLVHLGDVVAGQYNVISGNSGVGVRIDGGDPASRFEGNFIGTDTTGTLAIGNMSHGVLVTTSGRQVITNTIAFNGGDGVRVLNATTTGVRISNTIHSNAGLGIDLGGDGVSANDAQDPDGGANGTQNYPSITTARASLMIGTLNSRPNSPFGIAVYRSASCDPSGFGEGEVSVGFANVTTDASGDAEFIIDGLALPVGSFVTAVATSATDGSSEFSACAAVTADAPLNLTVTNASDSGPRSLRSAINFSNSNSGFVNQIGFNIPGGGTRTITPATPLPIITTPARIDGTTQPGYAGVPLIELDGSAAGGGGIGLRVQATGSTVRALTINRFGTSGVEIRLAGNVTIERSYIGVDATGTAARPNGIGIMVAGPSANNVIGGVGPARNLISGNINSGVQLSSATDNRIEGNFIGLDVTGTAAVGNQMGVFIDSGSSNDVVGNVLSGNNLYGVRVNAPANVITSNRIGTNSAGSAAVRNNAHGIYITNASNTQVINNLVSGNTSDGIFIQRVSSDPTGTLLQGNFIGTNADGTAAIPNNIGVRLEGISNATIGGNNAAQRNVISGNIVDGVNLSDGPSSLQTTLNTIKGNYIGLNATGTAALANGFVGVSIGNSLNNTVGGSLPGEGNVISGNAAGGVRIGASPAKSASNNTIIGNLIGINPAGSSAISNGGPGVNIVPSNGGEATGNRIGGAGGDRNVIGGNSIGVNILGTASNNASLNRVIGNSIGIGADGVTAIANGTGVSVTGDSNLIGQPGAGNVISGNTGQGIKVGGWSNIIQGNRIGTNANGDGAVANGVGITIENRVDVIVDALIGGESSGEGNLISGNTGPGIAMAQEIVNPDLLNPDPGNPAPWQTEVKGNFIGTKADGLSPLPNGGHGISATLVSRGVVGGVNSTASNLIYYNLAGGIVVADDARVTITANSIDSNGGLDIDLGNDGITPNDVNDPDGGPNQRQNYPFVNAVGPSGGNTEISVSFQSTPNTTFTLQVYSSPTCNPSGSGGGRTLRSTRVFTTDASGNLGFVHVFAGPTPSGHVITITATDPAGNTSEFSPCRAMP